MRATEVKNLREEVTAILTSARPQDEVFVSIESGGGYANAYGLGASQLQRIKDRNIKLTVAVDRVAASGGYLMACVADKIIAAPFAIIGSIGVVGQLPNFSKLLKEKHVDYELLTSGKYKRTLTMFGENTEDGRNKFQQDINELHEIFKVFIKDHRNVDIDKVGTGEYWCAIKAKELNLVDELMTSDEYLMKESADSDIFEIKYNPKKTLGERFADATTESLKKAVSSVLERDKNGEMFYF
jgi:serine protease SohB